MIVVDDSSTDGTAAVVERIAAEHPQVRCLPSPYENGFGFAVRAGLEAFEGDAVAIVMADGSDSPEDIVSYQRLLEEGYECAFGSRFVHGATVLDYPRSKLIMNRIVNFGIRVLFRHGYNDTTNAFKAYRREVIENVQPFLSHHFNLTVELPLKAVVRGYSYGIVPISWTNRKAGVLEAARSTRWAAATSSSSSTSSSSTTSAAATTGAMARPASDRAEPGEPGAVGSGGSSIPSAL